ncbi:MAG TPA: calcium-binding protein [Phycisphaerae bacterium]|nr:calcium-binding protein [Phycisphaerae bacterium]HRY69583.1 calcium-binding protein [Phycisphaerae bacterium]HSA27302.1 calcium-binding protein [Phycisphaerae bacterium]
MHRCGKLCGFLAAWLAIQSLATAACVSDLDGDGVCDNVDSCPGTIPGAIVDTAGCPLATPGDLDHDGDVGPDDLAMLNSCWSGPAIPSAGTSLCQAADFDNDADVDLSDFGVFQRCYSGANQPADPGCTGPAAVVIGTQLFVFGTAASDRLALRLRSGVPAILEVDFEDDGSADFTFDRALFDHVRLSMGWGHDLVRIEESNGVFTDTEAILIDGGSGNDELRGGSGPETFLGGSGDDTVDGNRGNDVALLGDGDDVFRWNPGDGSDTVEGQAGSDTLIFNGSGAGEVIDVSANGQRLRLFRNVGSIIMDLNDIDRIDLGVAGGSDIVTLNDLTGTSVTQINVNLASTLNGAVGDGQADNVIVDATDGDDNVAITGSGAGTTVTGLAAVVNVTAAEGANDRLTVRARNGSDQVQAEGLVAGSIALTVNGGIGNDALTGSQGSDVLNGDDDHDTINGGGGDDLVNLGIGDDRFVWNPGDDTDLVEGAEGIDTVEVNGGIGAEDFTVIANGTRVRLDRVNPAPFALDIGTCESLVINASAGNDTVTCTGNLAALIQITMDGGAGDDTLRGSNGADLILGGDGHDFVDGNQGNDVAFLGAGDDTFQWDPGDGSDTVEGQAGIDGMVFNGSGAAETIDISANGQRLRLFRNVGSVTVDVDDVEQIGLKALGGADVVTVNNLAGTNVIGVGIDLANPPGSGIGDVQADTIILNGTAGADTVLVSGSSGTGNVLGLASQVGISGSEAASDRLIINALAGDDVVDASGLAATAIQLTSDGGTEDDVLIGGDGNDFLMGGAGDDVLLGGPGIDVLDGGAGNNILIP